MTLYITKNGEKLGPYTLAEAQNLVATGTVLATDWAWYEGLTTWVPLNQVPGFVSTEMPPPPAPPRAGRPLLVWIISLLFFCCMPFSLIGLAIIPMMASGAIPVQEAQKHYFESQTAFDYIIALVNMAGCLVWAILFFMLKRASLYLYIGLLALGLFILVYNIVAEDWLAAVGVPGMITAALTWAINFAILYYNWLLCRKGVMR